MNQSPVSIVLKATDETRAAFASAQGGLSKLKTSANSLSASLAGIGASLGVGAFATFVKSTIDSADALNDLAVRTGTSVEALASLKLAAQLADTDLNALGAGMGKLSIYMAQNAEEAQKLGLTARDPAQAMAQLADAIAKVNDPAQRNALAMHVLGKSYSELMPLLAQGGDEIRRQASDAAVYAKRMGEMAKQAGEFNDSLDKLKQSASEASIALAGPIVGALNNAADQFRLAEEEGGKLHAMLIALGALSISAVGGNSSPQGILESQIRSKLAELQVQKDLIGEMQGKKDAGTGFLYYADDRIDSARKKIAGLQDELKPALAALEDMRRKTAAATANKFKLNDKLDPKFSDQLAKNAAPKLDQLDPFGAQRSAAADAAFKAMIDAQNAAYDALAESRDYAIAQDEQAAAALGRMRAEQIALLDPIQQYRDKLAEVQTLLDAGLFTPDQAVTANLYWQEQIEGAAGFGEQIKQTKSEFDLFAEEALKGFQSGLSDFLFDPFADGLDGMLKGFGSMLQRMAADAIAADVTRAIFGNAGSAGGGQNLLGAAAELFGFANGGAFTVGGSGSTDSQLVAFRATPGEDVTIRTPAQQRERQPAGGGMTINGPLMVVHAADAASFSKSAGQIQADLARALAGARRFT